MCINVTFVGGYVVNGKQTKNIYLIDLDKYHVLDPVFGVIDVIGSALNPPHQQVPQQYYAQPQQYYAQEHYAQERQHYSPNRPRRIINGGKKLHYTFFHSFLLYPFTAPLSLLIY